MNSVSYSYRPFPASTHEKAQAIVALMKRKDIVSMDDMKKATGKGWVNGALQIVKMTRRVESVREGRKLLGFTLKRGKGQVSEKIPHERFKVVGGKKAPRFVVVGDRRAAAPIKKPRKKAPKPAVEAPTNVEATSDAA